MQLILCKAQPWCLCVYAQLHFYLAAWDPQVKNFTVLSLPGAVTIGRLTFPLGTVMRNLTFFKYIENCPISQEIAKVGLKEFHFTKLALKIAKDFYDFAKIGKSKSGNTGLRLISYSFGYESKICHLFFVLVQNSLFVIELRKIDWRKCLKISIKTPVVGLAKDSPCQFDLRVLSTRNIFSLFKLSWLTLR